MKFQDLPIELLGEVVSYLQSAKSLSSLSRTCRKLQEYVQKQGWPIFLRTYFPSIPVARFGRDAAQTLTTLSRNWDRRALLARHLNVEGKKRRHPILGLTCSTAQTMGFVPAIDSYEGHLNSSWSARRQVLAVGAGPCLLLKLKQVGNDDSGQWVKVTRSARGIYDEGDPENLWLDFRPVGAQDGFDDITALKLLRPYQVSFREDEATVSVVFTTASGELCIGIADFLRPHDKLRQSCYNTSGKVVRALDVSPSKKPLLAAGLEDQTLAIFDVFSGQDDALPLSRINTLESGDETRIWTARFVSPEMLVIGRGPSTRPLQLYAVTPTGLSTSPLREFR